MDSEGILLRQPHHVNKLVGLLTDQNFAKQFADLKLIFYDGELSFYKLLLAALSRDWKRILDESDEADTVILEGVKMQEFLSQIGLDMVDMVSGAEDSQVKIESEEEVTENVSQEELDIQDDDEMQRENLCDTKFKALDVLKDTFPIDDTKLNINVEVKIGERILSHIKPDFQWPTQHQLFTKVNFPNFHSIGWGSASGYVFEVMGNRSIFTVLKEKYANLPITAAITIMFDENGKETGKSGILSLRDFLNGGASNSIQVFLVEGTEDKLSLKTVLEVFGYNDESNIHQDAKNIKITIGDKNSNLKDWMDIWKTKLAGDTVGQELVNGAKFDRHVTEWVRSQASTTLDGGVICCYCGLVCYEQSTKPFENHIRRHLYRKRKCNLCNEAFLAGDKHQCKQETPTKIKKKKKYTCTECDSTFVQNANLKRHLKDVHYIVDKVVVIKECGFCLKMVPDLATHIVEFHKNETIRCEFCDKTFSNPAKHKSHVRITHKKAYAGFCDICQKEVTHLTKHIAYSHQQPWPCDHCDKVFKLKSTLRDHMQSVAGTRVKKPCPECGKLYVNVNDHVRTFHRGYRRNLKKSKRCGNCDKDFSPVEYDEHRLGCKREETICHICSKSVVMIEQHLAIKHKVANNQCCLCSENFMSTDDLNNHMRSIHLSNIMKEAGFLENAFLTEDVFIREAIATKIVEIYSVALEGKMQCKLCSCVTPDSKVKMMVHMKDHLGYNWRKGRQPGNQESESMCPGCGKIVKNLNSHQASCKKKVEKLVIKDNPDPSEKTHSCPECKLQGLTDQTYVEHIMNGCIGDREMIVELELDVDSVTKEEKVKKKVRRGVKKIKVTTEGIDFHKNFPCDLCSSTFSKRPYLNRHMKRVHGGKNS